AYTPILFFNYDGDVRFQLHPSNEFNKNTIIGGPLNAEYQQFLSVYNSSFNEPLATLDARLKKLRDSNDYDRPEYRILVKQWQAEKNFDKRQALLNDMSEWQKTGRQLTANGNLLKAGYDSILDRMAAMRYQYMRDHTSLPAYFLMVSDMRYGSRNRLAANAIAEVYPRFASEFPNHPYTKRVGAELNGMLKIRPGEKLTDISIPDIGGKMHSVLKAIDGKVAIIDFWGSWCGPCIAKTKQLLPLYNSYKNNGFTIVGIAREYKNDQQLRRRLAMEKWQWLQLLELDDKNKVWTKFGIADATGMMLLVDKDGIIVSVDPKPEEVQAFLEKKKM
ncbi:MAG: TlpA family protein disulfide reductase, partial [Chitinophagaceae bacterium]|nr:TlpA family protein disulfide reductase [Chitinophagaceae bacterium]